MSRHVRPLAVGTVAVLFALVGSTAFAAQATASATAVPADGVTSATVPDEGGIVPCDGSTCRVAFVDGASPPVESAVVLLAYSRHDDSDPLENEKRRRLYETVERLPGQHLADVARESDVSVSTARYHVRVLESEQHVDAVSIRGRKRLYPASFDGDPELAAALREDATAAVLDAVDQRGPLALTSLASALDRTPSTVSHHVDRLVEAGLLRRERDGRSKRVSLPAAVHDRLSSAGD